MPQRFNLKTQQKTYPITNPLKTYQTQHTTHNLAFSHFSPFTTQDQNIFNLIHGRPDPVDAQLLEKSHAVYTASLNITNTMDVYSNNQESIYLDYESWHLNHSYQRGLNEQWNIKITIPIIYKGGGIFDSFINKWHDIIHYSPALRIKTQNNQYHIEYHNNTQASIVIEDNNTQLGDISLALARKLKNTHNTTISVWSALKLPTGNTNQLSSSGNFDLSSWLAINQYLTQNLALNINAGMVILGGSHFKNMPLARSVYFGHILFNWSYNPFIDLKLQLEGHSSYYKKSQLRTLGSTYFVTIGGHFKISPCHQIGVALNEDLKLNATPDVSFLINWRYAFNCT